MEQNQPAHGYRGPTVVQPAAKSEPESMAEILAEQEPQEILEDETDNGIISAGMPLEPVSELDSQILKLKVAKDEVAQQGREIDQVLAGLLESKRNELLSRIIRLQQELADLDTSLGQEPQNGSKAAKRGGKRPSGGGWNKGLTMAPRRGKGWSRGQNPAGSQTGRIIALLRGSPEREFPAWEIAAKANVPIGNINGCLQAAVERGEVRKRKIHEANDRPSGRTVWSWIGAKP